MKKASIIDLRNGDIINGEVFAIYELKKAEDRNGKTYYDLLIGDKTGKIKGKIWSETVLRINQDLLASNKILQFSGKVDEFKGKCQLNITNITEALETDIDDFVVSSEYNPDEMMIELIKEINEVNDTSIKNVLLNIVNDDEVNKKLKYSTAAKSIHHDFRSGLLQHILEMISISKGLKRFYPKVNYDVLKAGIILHDIGKIEELDSTGLATQYTKKGSLLGHIVIGTQIFEKFGGKDLPEDTYLHISHLILSHHGMIEMGSPIVPATVEAIMLTYIDDLSAKSRTATSYIDAMPDSEEFSSYNMWLENARLWKTPYLNREINEVQDNKDLDPSNQSKDIEDNDQIPLV